MFNINSNMNLANFSLHDIKQLIYIYFVILTGRLVIAEVNHILFAGKTLFGITVEKHLKITMAKSKINSAACWTEKSLLCMYPSVCSIDNFCYRFSLRFIENQYCMHIYIYNVYVVGVDLNYINACAGEKRQKFTLTPDQCSNAKSTNR